MKISVCDTDISITNDIAFNVEDSLWVDLTRNKLMVYNTISMKGLKRGLMFLSILRMGMKA